MRIARKSWHYRWRAWWYRRFGFTTTVECPHHTRGDYLTDMFMFTVALPITLLVFYGEKGLTALGRQLSKVRWPKLPQRPKREPKPPQHLEFYDCEEVN